MGFYGFGASAHLLAQLVTAQGKEVYAFTRPDSSARQQFARSLGVKWAGSVDEIPDPLLDAAFIFAPAGELVPRALQAIRKGGSVILTGIHMTEIPAFSYDILWGEKRICSVANLTRQDGQEFLACVDKIPLTVHTTVFPLEQANEALDAIRQGKLSGAAVLRLV